MNKVIFFIFYFIAMNAGQKYYVAQNVILQDYLFVQNCKIIHSFNLPRVVDFVSKTELLWNKL